MSPELIKRSRKRAFRPVKAAAEPLAAGAAASNIVNIGQFGTIKTGDSLLVRFHDQSRPSGHQDLPLDRWCGRGELGDAVAGYLASWGKGRSPSTRKGFVKLIGWFDCYLLHRESLGDRPIRNISEITTEVAEGYKKWLDSLKISKMTRSLRYDPFRRVMEWLALQKCYASLLSPHLRIQPNPWPGRHLDVKSHESLSETELKAVRRACIKEIKVILAAWKLGDEAIADSALNVPRRGERSPASFDNIHICIKAFATYFPNGCLPSWSATRASYPGFVRALTRFDESLGKIARYLYLTPRTAVPFVVLLAIDTFYNPSTILSLRWSNIIKHHPIFGTERWRLLGSKGGSALQRRSFPSGPTDPMTTVNLIRALEIRSISIVDYLPLLYKDRVFVFWQHKGKNPNNNFRAFGKDQDASEDTVWHTHLQDFIEENKLPAFALTSLRTTGSDLVHNLTAGDLKAQQQVLGHASAATTERSYQSGPAKRRRREALASTMQLHERFVETKGKSDTRDGRLREGRNSAATPGFACAEPTSSPQPGQRQGRMCTAYGKCPGCELCLVNTADPAALVRVTQLRTRISDARLRLDPQRWLTEWQPELAAIDSIWIPKFSPAVRKKAETLVLPSIPDVE